jgi:hypothetical protein
MNYPLNNQLTVMKSNDEKRFVFGWASIAVRVTGEEVVDFQDDVLEIEELEQAVYDYVIEFRSAGEMHRRGGVGKLIESVVFTKEKAAAMDIPDDILPEGWWVGFHIEDPDVWLKVKDGTYSMFSIEGTATRQQVT